MKTLALLALVISALAGNVLGGAPPMSTAAASVPAVGDHSDCAGGAAELVTTTIEPRAIVAGPRGQRAELAIDVHQELDDQVELVGAVEVIDDRGNRIGTRYDLPYAQATRGVDASFTFETPDDLPDGYYRVLVSLLARGAASGDEDFSTRELYLHVAGGTVTPVSSDEWLTRSNSGLVFTRP